MLNYLRNLASKFARLIIMKKVYLLFFLIFISSSQIFAQTQTSAQAVLDKMAAKIKSAQTVTTSFTLTQYDKTNTETGSSKGLVKIKGKKYYLKEGTTEIFCDGSKSWNLSDNEVIVSNANDSDEDDFTPQILSGFNQKDFTATLLSSTGSNYEVSLVPVDKRKNFKQVILSINKTTNLVTKAKVTDKTNNITAINFSNITLNTNIPDSQFTFDATKHPGVEIINQ